MFWNVKCTDENEIMISSLLSSSTWWQLFEVSPESVSKMITLNCREFISCICSLNGYALRFHFSLTVIEPISRSKWIGFLIDYNSFPTVFKLDKLWSFSGNNSRQYLTVIYFINTIEQSAFRHSQLIMNRYKRLCV